MEPGRAVVVGAGIGGLATAVALGRVGWQVRVLERAPELTEVGAGLSLWPNALRALDALGLGDRVRGAGVVQATGGLRRPDGRWLARADSREVSRRFGDVVMLARPELLDVLRGAVDPPAIRTGVEVTGLEQLPGRVVVSSSGGGVEEADLVVGADGIRSLVRGLLWREPAEPRHAGYVAYRLLTPPLPDAAGEGAETWGRGVRFGYVPLRDGRVYCFAAVDGAPAAALEGVDPLTGLEALVGRWHEPVPTLLAAARAAASPVLLHDIEELPDLATFTLGRVALLGDAAHAMTPNLGQGACQALEDAVELAAALAAEPDVPAALARYDTRRRPRTQGIARRSRRVGQVAQWSAPPLVAVRDVAARLTPPAVALRGLAPVLSWRPPALSEAGASVDGDSGEG